LPVISESRNLKFYDFSSELDLIEKNFNVKEPNPEVAKEIFPEVIITPLLAFDNNKNRLGYGKGYYDNTFLELKKKKIDFISIGIAYQEQLFPDGLPIEEHDFTLDYIVTPDKIYK